MFSVPWSAKMRFASFLTGLLLLLFGTTKPVLPLGVEISETFSVTCRSPRAARFECLVLAWCSDSELELSCGRSAGCLSGDCCSSRRTRSIGSTGTAESGLEVVLGDNRSVRHLRRLVFALSFYRIFVYSVLAYLASVLLRLICFDP